ncbi:MAG: hypothetical protein DRI92_04805 [Aquificota bacterium]|nr:MAG: hypothetical protein DRI92_04805 [Aquificota bacterium]
MKKIVFSKHALLKIEEWKLSPETVEAVVTRPDSLFFDILSRALVAIKKVEIGDVETNLIVVFKPEDGGTRVITAYPCKNIDKEVKAKEGKRWLKIK